MRGVKSKPSERPPLFFDDCILVEGGRVPEDICRRLSSVKARNIVSCADCESPWRICTACIGEGKANEHRKINSKTGLCQEHEGILTEAKTVVSIPEPKSIFEIALEIKKAIGQETAKNDGRTRKMIVKDLAKSCFKKSEAWILLYLSLLKLDPGIKVFFDPKLSEDKKLDPKIAFCLAVLPVRFQNQMAIQAVKRRWTQELTCRAINKLQKRNSQNPRTDFQAAPFLLPCQEKENSLKNEFCALLRILRKNQVFLRKLDQELLWENLKGISETERLAAAAQLENCANGFICLASLIFPEIKNKTEV